MSHKLSLCLVSVIYALTYTSVVQYVPGYSLITLPINWLNIPHLCAHLINSLAKEVMFLVALVCLSVYLFVCLSVDNITQKNYELIGMKFYGGVLGSTMKN